MALESKPKVEVTTTVTTKIVGRWFTISPRGDDNEITIRREWDNLRHVISNIHGNNWLDIPLESIDELIAMLQESKKMNPIEPSKITATREI